MQLSLLFATSCWHLSKARGGECNTLYPPERRKHCLLGATQPLCFITEPFITILPKRLLYQVWRGSEFFDQEMIITSHDSCCGLVVMLHMRRSRSSVSWLKWILPLLTATCTGGIWCPCRVEAHVSESWQLSRGRTIYTFKGHFRINSLSSFHLHMKPVGCFLCKQEGFRPLWSSSDAAILLTWQWFHFCN